MLFLSTLSYSLLVTVTISWFIWPTTLIIHLFTNHNHVLLSLACYFLLPFHSGSSSFSHIPLTHSSTNRPNQTAKEKQEKTLRNHPEKTRIFQPFSTTNKSLVDEASPPTHISEPTAPSPCLRGDSQALPVPPRSPPLPDTACGGMAT